MPKREDEFWAGQKEDLRYCSKHKRYYKKDAGCQLCQFERWGREQKRRAPLQECPDCQRNSLCWNKKSELYECLNPECGHTFTENKLRARELEAPVEKVGKEQIPEEKPQLQSCPICREKALFWDKSSELYECLNRRCRRRFTKSELDNIMQGVVTIEQVTTPPVDDRKSRVHRDKYYTPDSRSNVRIKKRDTSKKLVHVLYGVGWLTLGIGLLSFGILRMATWLNLLSIPWLDGWGEVFIWFVIPWEVFPIGFGGYLIHRTISRLGLIRVGLALFITASIYSVVIFNVAPDLPKIIFWRGEDGERMEELIEPNIFSVAVGADGHQIWLHNNPEAKNPTWEELLVFLKDDKTDQHTYSLESFVCADFAEMLHNNAEEAGIRAAYVVVDLSNTGLYIPFSGGHALNALKTTDRGLVYIDCTGSNFDIGCDNTVDVEIGKEYIPKSLFPEPGWDVSWQSMGTILGIDIEW